MVVKRQIEIALSRTEWFGDCLPYVGSPRPSPTCTSLYHKPIDKCSACRLNLCQGCGGPATDVCVQCGEAGCVPCVCDDDACAKCHELSLPTFSGWMGICRGCKAGGVTATKVPRTVSAKTGGTHEVVKHPNLTTILDFRNIAAEYEQRYEEGLLALSQLKGYDHSQTPARCRLVGVYQIHNIAVAHRFDAQCNYAGEINRARPESARYRGTGVMTVFHGTHPAALDSILRRGFDVRHNRNSVYGSHAIYVSKYPCVAERHSAMTPKGYKYLLWCEALVGNNVPTKGLAGNPLPQGADTGGDGTPNIIAVFSDAQICAKYMLQFAC
jgi:hypothetical protein